MTSDNATVYPEALARHYDLDYVDGRAADVTFYTSLARAATGRVLEVGCGTGRIVLPMARSGIEVVGVDPSPLMREQVAAKLEREPRDIAARVTVLDGTFEHIPDDGPFAFVCSVFRAIMHLTSAERLRAGLAEMARVLEPGGTLVFDAFAYDPELGQRFAEPHNDVGYEHDGERVERWASSTYDPETQLLHATFEWRRGERVEGPVTFPLRCTTAHEVTDLAEQAGLVVDAIWSDVDGTPADPDRPGDLFVFARRPR